MITAAVQALVPARWVAADEAYANNASLRARLRVLRLGYVLAVSRDHLLPIDGGKTRCRADHLSEDLPATAWTRRSAGDGRKGHGSTTGLGWPTAIRTTTAGKAC